MIEALMILHNITEELHDDPYTISGFNGKEDDDVAEMFEELHPRRWTLDADELYQTGLARRKRLLELSQQI
jgi:hypothetical protein